MMRNPTEKWFVLGGSTLAFTVCFAVWMMFAVIGIPIKQALDLNETQFGLLAAMPVLTGSLIRLPLGMWTDKFGGRVVFFVLMLVTVVPIWLIGEATEYWQFLVLGLFVGLAGGSFSVGIAYVARWFNRRQQGLAMGIFGAGNSGAAVTKFVAPAIVVAFGWAMVPKIYAAAMIATALLFWALSRHDKTHVVPRSVTVRQQLAALRDPKVWKYSRVLLDRLRRVRRTLALDDEVLRERVRLRPEDRGASRGVLLASRRRVARDRRMALRQVRRPPGHLVGDADLLGLPLLPLLSADGRRSAHASRRRDDALRTECLDLHGAHVRDGDRMGDRQGVGVQVRLRRIHRTTSVSCRDSSA